MRIVGIYYFLTFILPYPEYDFISVRDNWQKQLKDWYKQFRRAMWVMAVPNRDMVDAVAHVADS